MQMASLLCGLFHAFLNHNFVEMLFHTWNMKMASLLYASFHAPSISLEQANGFSPVWVLSCTFKLPLWLKAFSQLEQANGFSPVWVLSCSFKWALFQKVLLHLEQSLSSVGPFMHLQITTLVKSFFTFETSKWQLCQNTLSSGNITHSGEKTYPYKQCEATCFFFRKDMPNFWSHCLQ